MHPDRQSRSPANLSDPEVRAAWTPAWARCPPTCWEVSSTLAWSKAGLKTNIFQGECRVEAISRIPFGVRGGPSEVLHLRPRKSCGYFPQVRVVEESVDPKAKPRQWWRAGWRDVR